MARGLKGFLLGWPLGSEVSERRAHLFVPPQRAIWIKLQSFSLHFSQMRLFQNLSPREESLFHVLKVRISPTSYDVECNMGTGSPSSVGASSDPSLAQFPIVFQDVVFEPERRLKQKGIPGQKNGSWQGWTALGGWLYLQPGALSREGTKH